MSEKLQKVLARSGLASRREIERWIEAGRISIDGKLATLGDRVTEENRIRVDGKIIANQRLFNKPTRVIIYHKPVGEVCTRSDPEGRPTIFDQLPELKTGRWVSIGRLDINTSGLLLLTTDGAIANAMMHPSSEIEREYAVRILGEVSKEMLAALREGVELEDGPAHFDSISDQGGTGVNHWYHVILKEGRNREVRRLWESQGVKVSRLSRVRYGPFKLHKSIRVGRWEEVNKSEIERLSKTLGLSGGNTSRVTERDKRNTRRDSRHSGGKKSRR